MKTILITGATGGIGKSLAMKFANNNFAVAVGYNNSEEEAKAIYNDITNSGNQAILVKGDISDSKQCEAIVNEVIQKLGHIDVLINNAGISSNDMLIDETDEKTKQVIETNLLGTIFLTKKALKHMISFGAGKIINISSIWGVRGASCEATYSASKAAIISLTQSLAKEVSGANITVNCIAPGVVDTKMNNNLNKEEKAQLMESIPLGRFASAEEIADIAFFLASESAGYITGQTIVVDGGILL
ncbi:MAG: 3-oxoacyl-ACP reductase FabG [Clostridia bacterium]|nr:3-oxoacyl-ACP reductase FabG [Clostridia bacterium]